MTDTTYLSLLTGSFSQPAGDNPTVAMVEAAYRAMGLDARYVNCDVSPDRLAAAVGGAVAMGWRGFNCSLPHKVSVIELLDELTEAATIIGAVNCVSVHDSGGTSRLVGENTDGKGFVASLRSVVDPSGQHVVIFGAGGAARAIAVETALAGAAHLTIVNRTAERGRQLAGLVAAKTRASAEYASWTTDFAIPASAGVVVNATSIGLSDTEARLDLDPTTLHSGQVVADVIPNPPRTALLRDAEAAGATTLTGLGMLVNQGVAAIRLWTGQEPDPAVMHAELTRIFG